MATAAATGASRRPGPLARAAAGAWHVPAGLALLLRSPKLWLLALAPALVAGALLGAGLLAGIYALPQAEAWLLPDRLQVREWLELAVFLALAFGLLLAGMAAGLAAALLVSAPLLERLSRRAESLLLPEKAGAPCTAGFGGLDSLGPAAVQAVFAPAAGLLALVPLVGPVLAGTWIGALLGWQQTSGPLGRHGLARSAARSWRRHYAWETLGLGLGAVVALWVPIANVLLPPALAIGATRLVLELGLEPGAEPERHTRAEPPAAEEAAAPPATNGPA